MFAVALFLALGPAKMDRAEPLRVLFMGNSHTMTNDVPGLVKGLIESNGRGRAVFTQTVGGADLNAILQYPQAKSVIAGGRWDFLVLQGAAMSSSHKYTYSQAGPIELARAGIAAGIKVRLFAEWPRRGWDETGFILGIYGQTVAQVKGVSIFPIPQAWDRALAKRRNLDLWSPDGNHASPQGSYLAACVIADRIAGLGRSRFAPRGLDPELAQWLRSVASSDPK